MTDLTVAISASGHDPVQRVKAPATDHCPGGHRARDRGPSPSYLRRRVPPVRPSTSNEAPRDAAPLYLPSGSVTVRRYSAPQGARPCKGHPRLLHTPDFAGRTQTSLLPGPLRRDPSLRATSSPPRGAILGLVARQGVSCVRPSPHAVRAPSVLRQGGTPAARSSPPT
ncbi:hypothetical protein NDU88_002321 [Pleurodeles waltl]|uniref:Uncharacterized protein n=1 Tax=Pleurodeles waltl TaxID=8319 RepID=A0AAV7UC06_PLEWA|nr:hypothetical protein NDU88_002321 [Pleurodeles waltl]